MCIASLWLVIENHFNFCHDIISELVLNLQRLEVFLDLLDLGTTQNDGASVWIFQCPSKCKLSKGALQPVGKWGKLFELRYDLVQ